jgi:hypothetical protein
VFVVEKKEIGDEQCFTRNFGRVTASLEAAARTDANWGVI